MASQTASFPEPTVPQMLRISPPVQLERNVAEKPVLAASLQLQGDLRAGAPLPVRQVVFPLEGSAHHPGPERLLGGLAPLEAARIPAVLQHVHLGSFFDPDELADDRVVRSAQRKVLRTRNGITYLLLTPEPYKHTIEFLYNRFEEGSSTETFYSHKGEECGIVLEGKLKVSTDREEYILDVGDSIVLDSTRPHKLTNIYPGRTIAIWANSPPSW